MKTQISFISLLLVASIGLSFINPAVVWITILNAVIFIDLLRAYRREKRQGKGIRQKLNQTRDLRK